MRRPGNHNNAHVVYVVGSTDTGKSTWLKRQLSGQERLIVWDPKGEYARMGFKAFASLERLRIALKENRHGRFSYVPSSMGDFETVCRLAYAWGACDFVAEELADVSTPSKAPQWWGILLRRGRDQALRVWATSQRPAEADKTILGNYTAMHCHQLVSAADRDYVTKKTGMRRDVLDELKQFHWVEIDRRGVLTRGKVTR